LGTASWESKLELLHSCVPKLELGNKVEARVAPRAGARIETKQPKVACVPS